MPTYYFFNVCPTPLHAGQVSTSSGSSAPDPLQLGHNIYLVK